jgi:F-type H+-transporting ATPase subunit delta
MAAAFEIYAKALFELAEEKAITAVVVEELRTLGKIFSSSAPINAALCEGLVDAKTRASAINEALKNSGINDLSKRFTLLLSSRRRLGDLVAVADELERLLNKKSGLLVGELTSAVAMSGEEISALSLSIGKRIGSRVELRPNVGAALLGGFVARVAGKTFDSSLQTQLEKLRATLSH